MTNEEAREAFGIFAKYDGGGDVNAQHNEIHAGPGGSDVSPDDLERLSQLGWIPDSDGGFLKFTSIPPPPDAGGGGGPRASQLRDLSSRLATAVDDSGVDLGAVHIDLRSRLTGDKLMVSAWLEGTGSKDARQLMRHLGLVVVETVRMSTGSHCLTAVDEFGVTWSTYFTPDRPATPEHEVLTVWGAFSDEDKCPNCDDAYPCNSCYHKSERIVEALNSLRRDN